MVLLPFHLFPARPQCVDTLDDFPNPLVHTQEGREEDAKLSWSHRLFIYLPQQVVGLASRLFELLQNGNLRIGQFLCLISESPELLDKYPYLFIFHRSAGLKWGGCPTCLTPGWRNKKAASRFLPTRPVC